MNVAVNLKATATLDIKPFKTSLAELATLTSNLDKTTLKGHKAIKDSTLAQAAAHEKLGQARLAEGAATARAAGTASRSLKQVKYDADEYARAMGEVQKTTRRVTDSYAQMTPAMARHSKAIQASSRANTELARQMAAGLEGPALTRYQTAATNAAHAVGRARAAVIAENDKLIAKAEAQAKKQAAAESKIAETARKSAEAQTLKNAALAKGTADAAKYTSGLKGMSQERLALQAATERLTAAESRLASALARSNGLITPAVSSARAGVISAITAYDKLVESQKKVADAGPRAASGLAAQRYLYHDVARQAAGVSLALAAIPAIAVSVGAVWENQFANVVRTADPALRNSTTRVDALRESLTGMAKSMPISFGNITEIATLGNQMGVAANELEGFTKSVAMFSATSGVAVDTAATAFGRLRTVAADANFSYMGVADSILKVGVNSVATEEEIINVTTQISSIAASAGFSTQEMIGLSGALASVRVPPELSRSIITRTFGQFDKAIQNNGVELQSLARISGRSVENIKEQWGGPGAAGIFVDFMDGIKSAGRGARDELKLLGITSVRDVPALMRLATAADSDGKRGGLLSQTLDDANNARGAVQEQYAIMAETVVGRLKVLGNSVLSFFDTLGSGSNSFVKGAIDGLTTMFNTMEKIVDNPFSSWALGAMAAVSGIALATAGLAKLTAGVKMFQHVSEVVGSKSFFNAIGMTGKGGGTAAAAAGMSPMLAGTASLINSFKTGVKSAGTTWKNLGSALSATGAWAVAGRSMKDTALGATSLKDALKASSVEVPKATGLLGNLARFGLHPVTLGLAAVGTIGAIAYNDWSKGFHMASTTTDALAESFTKIDMTKASEVSTVLKGLEVSGTDVWRPWEKGYKPFADGLPGLLRDLKVFTDYQAELEKFSGSGTENRFGRLDAYDNAKAQGIEPSVFKHSMGVVDKAFSDMRAAGNDAAVMDFWATFSKQSGTASQGAKAILETMELMPGEAEALERQFRLQNMSTQEGLKNIQAINRSVQDAAIGFDGASIIGEAFNIDTEAAAAFGKTMNDAASAFIDFGAALEAGTQTDDDGAFTGFDLSAWTKSLETSGKAQDKWMGNIRKLSRLDGFSSDMVQAMGEMGVAGQHLAQELVNGINDDGTLTEGAQKAMTMFQDSVNRSKIEFGANLADYNNVLDTAENWLDGKELNLELQASFTEDDWASVSNSIRSIIDHHGPELGKLLGSRLMGNLNEGKINLDQFNTLADAMGGLGFRASRALMDELDRGISPETLIKRIERMEAPKIPVEVEADSTAERRIEGQFKQMFAGRGLPVPAEIKMDTKISTLRELLGDHFLPEIKGELTLNEVIASKQFAMFREWALAQGIDIEMQANPAMANVALQSWKYVADNTVAQATVEALTAPAEGAFWNFYTLADGKIAAVQVNAETGEAVGKVSILDQEASDPAEKLVTANTDQAQETLKLVKAQAEESSQSEHTITADTSDVDEAKIRLSAGSFSVHTITVNEEPGTKVNAFGNIYEAYAHGGVREDHRPQIAPAGAMRLWAEPETGGEAYIPFAMDRRKRAEGILSDVANRFGFNLQPQNYTKYADGGQYMAQSYSRQRTAATYSRGIDGEAKVHIDSVEFTQSNQKDQFREFSRTINRVARGL